MLPAGDGDFDNNPNISKAQWNHNFRAVMCPETMNDMKEQNKYLPKFNGSQLCLRYQAKGSCYKNCVRGATHVKLHGRTKKCMMSLVMPSMTQLSVVEGLLLTNRRVRTNYKKGRQGD